MRLRWQPSKHALEVHFQLPWLQMHHSVEEEHPTDQTPLAHSISKLASLSSLGQTGLKNAGMHFCNSWTPPTSWRIHCVTIYYELIFMFFFVFHDFFCEHNGSKAANTLFPKCSKCAQTRGPQSGRFSWTPPGTIPIQT